MVDAAEAHADLSMSIQLQQAGTNRPVSTAPTAGIRRLDEVAADDGERHHPSLGRDAPADSDAAEIRRSVKTME